MALYHFSVRNVSRGKGQMVVASAAYISGQRIFDSYYNKIHDYTSKSGVIFTEILTPEYVPERLTDRETLWNEVEHVERNNKAQLAYSFDIALQNELTLEENIRLAKEFCQEQFVARGMIVDLAVHEGKAENEEEPDNPHFHVLVPIRPFTEEGIWGNKQRREYILDEDGNRVKDAKGKDMFNAVSTTGWNDPELLKEWRRAWTEKVNGKFRECHMASRIDHRSYKEQGIDLIPTIHEGYEVRAMEKKGIKTVIGELNRAIRSEIQIWTDIDGMHDNDPRVVDKTSPVRQLHFEEAAELAYFGAKILHPTCVQPAKYANIPVRLLNTIEPSAPGTLISNETEKGKIKAVAAKDNITAIKIKSSRMLLAHGFLRKVFEIFESYQTPIDMVCTSEVGVSMSIDNTKHLNEIVNDLKKYGTVTVDHDMCIVCVVGDLEWENIGFEAKAIQAMRNIPVRMISFGGSNYNISFLIRESDKKTALQSLSDVLFNNK